MGTAHALFHYRRDHVFIGAIVHAIVAKHIDGGQPAMDFGRRQ